MKKVSLAAFAGLAVLSLVAPSLSSGRSSSGVVRVGQFQRYAGEEGLGVGFGSLWVSSVQNGESVARMSIGTQKSVSISAPSDEDSVIGIGPNAVWMTDFADGIVRRIDPATNKVDAVAKGLPGADGFAFSGGDVWVALHHAQGIAELNGVTGKLIGRLAVPAPGGGVTASGPSDVAVGFGSIWTDVPNIAALVRLDPATHKVVAVIHDGANCCGNVVVAGDSVWITSGGSVDRIDPKTNTVGTRIHLTTADGLLAPLAVLDGRLWAAPGNTIVAIDPVAGRVVSRTTLAKAFFKDLATGDGALWAWDANTNYVDELRPR
jgi:streptogramin lyase